MTRRARPSTPWVIATAAAAVVTVAAAFLLLSRDGGVNGDGATPAALPEGWTSLMDPDLTGWHHSGQGRMVVEEADGEVTYRTDGGLGVLWHERRVSDFVLDLQFMVADTRDNAGVFLRIPAAPEGDDYLRRSFEVQIAPAGDGAEATGAIYGVQAPFRAAPVEPGRWHQLRIHAQGPGIRIDLDGTTVNEFQLHAGGIIEGFSDSGHIGLQTHGPDDEVRFRRVRVHEL